MRALETVEITGPLTRWLVEDDGQHSVDLQVCAIFEALVDLQLLRSLNQLRNPLLGIADEDSCSECQNG